MGLLDRARKLAEEHADKVGDAVDKVAHVVDGKTGGRYTDKIGKGTAAVKDFVGGGGDPAAGGPGAAEGGPGAGEVGDQPGAGPAGAPPAPPGPPPTATS